MSYVYSVAERLMRYVQIDTQSDPESTTFPSTSKQNNLSKILLNELLSMGIEDAELDEHGYVYATLKSNTEKSVPTICFCSHVDTAPDCSGKDVVPILHTNYQGQDIILPHDNTQIISPSKYPYLKTCIGKDIITASGKTLLGADDKAGVAIIMDFVQYMIANPQLKHGDIRILFTPDEEVGRGVEKIDMKKLGASYGYTLDGGERGALEAESFSADGVTITIHGISAHPGYAKDKLVSAIKIASHFIDSLPKDKWSPETTEQRQGYVHPTSIEGGIEKVVIKFIIRDFDTHKLQEHETQLKNILDSIMQQYSGARAEMQIYEQYRNMMDIIKEHPHVVAYAKEAIERAGLTVEQHIIRGGTDGSRLSFMGMPCPNIFTGMAAIHSKHEHVCVQDMQQAVDTLVHLSQIWAEKS